MIRDSDRFDNTMDELFGRLDKDKSFAYTVSADVFPQLKWKQPYQNMQVVIYCMSATTSFGSSLMSHLADYAMHMLLACKHLVIYASTYSSMLGMYLLHALRSLSLSC